MGDNLNSPDGEDSMALRPLVKQEKIDRTSAEELPEVFDDDESTALQADSTASDRSDETGQYDVEKDDMESDEEEEGDDRANWGGKLEFLFTCIGYAVGLGNVWRFPYLAYKNGGGAFLVPYVFMLALVGLPLFFMELSFGQFASLGPITIWKMNPLLKGLGYAMVSVSWLIAVYYNVVISHVLLYLFVSIASIADTQLPWVSCDNPWNTRFCISPTYSKDDNATQESFANVTASPTMDYEPTSNASIDVRKSSNEIISALVLNGSKLSKTPAEEYYNNYILEMSTGIEDAGGLNWKLTLCLLLAWIIVLVCLIRGIQSLGKVVYFTALFPYVMLTILLIRGLSLPGALNGIVFYLKPDFSKLLDARVWCDAATQIFYSLSACSGGLIAMSSYNSFNNNVLKDSLIVAIVNCCTSIYAGFVIFSILGFMALEKNVPVGDVAEGGPGLAFIVYPEAISRMPVPQMWAIFFFIMMATLGFGSQFSIMEAVLSGFSDEFIQHLKTKWRSIGFRTAIIIFTFFMGLPMVSRGGIYLLNLVDYSVSGFPLLIIGFLECVALNWIYGHTRFSKDIEMMLGLRPNIYWKVCWKYLTPLIISAIVVFNCIYYKPPTLDEYSYPTWAINLGWCIGLFPISLIIGFFLYRYCKDGGWDLLLMIQAPKGDWGPALPKHRTGDYQSGPNVHLSNIYIGPRPTITISPSKGAKGSSSLKVPSNEPPMNLRVDELRLVASRNLYKHHSAETGIDKVGVSVPVEDGASPVRVASSEQQLVKYPRLTSFKNALRQHLPVSKGSSSRAAAGEGESKV